MTEVSLMEKILANIQDRLGAFDGRLDIVEWRLGGVEEELGEVSARLGRVEQEVGGLRQEVGGLRQEVGGLRQEVGELREDMNGRFELVERVLAEQFSALGCELQTITRELRRVGSLSRRVDDHDKRIVALEGS